MFVMMFRIAESVKRNFTDNVGSILFSIWLMNKTNHTEIHAELRRPGGLKQSAILHPSYAHCWANGSFNAWKHALNSKTFGIRTFGDFCGMPGQRLTGAVAACKVDRLSRPLSARQQALMTTVGFFSPWNAEERE
jgi:hypothetical protein